MATHSINVTLENNTNRIVPTGAATVNLTLFVNNTGPGTHDITWVNITNATGYPITSMTAQPGWMYCWINRVELYEYIINRCWDKYQRIWDILCNCYNARRGQFWCSDMGD